MDNIEVKDGVLFVDGIEVTLKKGESDSNFLYGKITERDDVFIYGGTFYRGSGVMDAKFMGVILYEEFLSLKDKAT